MRRDDRGVGLVMSVADSEEIREQLRLSCLEGRAVLVEALLESASSPWRHHRSLEERVRRDYDFGGDEWVGFHREGDDETPEARMVLAASQRGDGLEVANVVPEHVGADRFGPQTWNALVADFVQLVVAPAMRRCRMSVERGGERVEFAAWNSYQDFERTVRNTWRYVWPDDISSFLATVRMTLPAREVELREGKILYRAQLGVEAEVREFPDGTMDGPVPYGRDRMTPSRDHISEGRANPRGAPVLYVASTPETAMAEVRPWKGSQCTVSGFRLTKRVWVVDVRATGSEPRHPAFSLDGGRRELEPAEKEILVWGAIGRAFSRPVERADSSTEYVPTQILAEVMRTGDYDGVLYDSAVGSGFNVAFFDIEAATYVSGAPYEVTDIRIISDCIGLPCGRVRA